MTDHPPVEPSEGVFYVVRLPGGWQLCTFRHDEYGPIGLPDCWVQVLEPFMSIWLARLAQDGPAAFKTHYSAINDKLGLLVADYDAFPRGEVRRGADRKHFIVQHGGEIARTMHIPRREIEEAFGIQGHAKWVEDEAYVSDHRHAQRLRGLFQIADKWEDAG
ncbi:MAG: hypothetical protein ABMA13_05805 [Chthoniobacteraceae bacterium]